MEKIDKKQIEQLLPHREPMLLIDELFDIKKLSSATAVVNVKKDSFFVQDNRVETFDCSQKSFHSKYIHLT